MSKFATDSTSTSENLLDHRHLATLLRAKTPTHSPHLVLTFTGGGAESGDVLDSVWGWVWGKKRFLNKNSRRESSSICVLLHYLVGERERTSKAVGCERRFEKYKGKMKRWREGSGEVKM